MATGWMGLRDDVVAALDDVEPRDAIQDGDEEGIAIDVPVHVGGTYATRRPSLRTLIKKGWNTIRQDTDRVTGAGWRVLASPGLRHRRIVADALEMGTNGYGLDLRMGDVCAGPARVASEELFLTSHRQSEVVRALVTGGRTASEAGADSSTLRASTGRTYATAHDTLETLDLRNCTG